MYLVKSKVEIPLADAASCCICEGGVARVEAVVERRPTGDSFMLEEWVYCRGCWSQMQELRRRSSELASLLTVLTSEDKMGPPEL